MAKIIKNIKKAILSKHPCKYCLKLPMCENTCEDNKTYVDLYFQKTILILCVISFLISGAIVSIPFIVGTLLSYIGIGLLVVFSYIVLFYITEKLDGCSSDEKVIILIFGFPFTIVILLLALMEQLNFYDEPKDYFKQRRR